MTEPEPEPRTTKALWVIVALVALGIVPFFVAALLARTAREKALSDPKARELLTDDDPSPIGGG